ncbi:MAG TPA: carboxypeptidase regulatory-like domain-containing protein, partial [Gemmatimonadaceae bacterium]|nr:carboxypeptidase regulatory-like domain-containing protein [Gemmatimonadaceae bacterium]
MPHPDEGTIHAWLDGALPDADATAVEAHVSECVSCREAVAEARGLIAAASRVVSALDVVPGGVLPETRPTATPAPARRARWAGWPLRAAAAVLLVAGGTAVVLRERGVTVLGESGAAATMTAAREAEPAAVPPAAPSNAPTPAPAPSVAAAPSTAAPSQRARAERRRVADTVRELAPLPQRAPRQELAAAPAPEPPVARAQPLQQLQGKLAGAPVVSSLQSEVAAQAGERRIMLRGAASLTVAGTGTVTGVVRDANGRELQAAQVTVQGTSLGTTTDSVGRFTLRGVPPGAQTLVARRVGYERARQQVTVRPDSIPELALELRAATVALS